MDSNLPHCTVCLRHNTHGGLYCGTDHCLQPPPGYDQYGIRFPSVLYTGWRDPEDALENIVRKHLPGECSAPLPLRLDLRNHSPTGFEWGYGGSGPAQLALAILADFTGDNAFALEHYQVFKQRVVARLPRAGWSLTRDEINAALTEEHS